jgi:carboxypeptidase C (cathepsin A)
MMPFADSSTGASAEQGNTAMRSPLKSLVISLAACAVLSAAAVRADTPPAPATAAAATPVTATPVTATPTAAAPDVATPATTAPVPPKKESAAPVIPREFVTHHSGTFEGREIRYSAIAGDTVLNNDAGKQSAVVFSFTYLREDVKDRQKRPVIFVFNGGPGSSSIWQHLGFFGPKRVRLKDEVHPPATPPFEVENNPHCLLDAADIVLIDPVGTGYSHLLPDGDPHDYYGVEQDGRATVEFIEHWLRKYDRLSSPRIIAGESYGVTRAIVVARMLMGGPFSATGRLTAIPLNGIVIMGGSPAMEGPQGNGASDLDYPSTLPTMAATAWYHGKTSHESRSLDDAIREAKSFAGGEYLNALYAGDALDDATRSRVVKRLSELTGLPVPFVQSRNLRIAMGEFRAELLRDRGLIPGAYDSRFTLPVGLNAGPMDPVADDAAMGQYSAAFVGAFDEYLKKDLKISVDAPYDAIEFKMVNSKWDYDSRLGPAGPTTRAQDLAATMRRNPNLRLLSVSGAYDAVIPLESVAYSLTHSGLPQDRVTIRTYPAGHMAYLGDAPSKALAEDLRKFLSQTAGQ